MKKTSEEVVAVVVVTATEEVVVVAETEKKTVQIQEEAKTEEHPKLGKVFNENGKTPINQKSLKNLFRQNQTKVCKREVRISTFVKTIKLLPILAWP